VKTVSPLPISQRDIERFCRKILFEKSLYRNKNPFVNAIFI